MSKINNALYLQVIERNTDKKKYEYLYTQINYYNQYIVMYHHFNDLKNNCKVMTTQYFNELDKLNDIVSPFVD